MSFIYEKITDFLELVEEKGDPRLRESWLMNTPWPSLAILIAYLYFVLKAGPEFMKLRNAINIDRLVMVYNVVQVLFSLYIFKEEFRLIWIPGDYRFICIEVDRSDTALSKEIIFVIWFYYISKILDLFDTVFFILRKKQNQMTFLHIYHHAMVLSLSWCILRFYPGGQIAFFGTINAFVHVVMYSYYFLTVFKPHYKQAWWKKYLTILQLIQFVASGTHVFSGLFATDCNYPKSIMVLALTQNMCMFYLFWDFYQKAYAKSPKNKKA